MKKVLFLIHDLGQGGAEKVLVNLVNNMDRAKFDITVMTLFDVGENKQFLSKDITYKTCFKKMFRGNSHLMKLLSPEQLHNIFITEEYDIEVAYLEGPCARIISGCKNSNTKLISWIHIEQHTAKKASASFRSFSEAQKCYSKFNKIVGVSKTVEQDFCDIFGMGFPTEVLYNTNESEKILSLSEEFIDDIEFSDEVINLVGVGKLLKNKGFDRIIRIISKLKENRYPVHLYILGSGPEKNNLENMVNELGLKDNVTLLGYQLNPYKYLRKCDLFICASLQEGFSTAATEALIVGVPVCTVEVSGMKEMLGENNEYGIVTNNDEEALYIAIKSLLDNRQLFDYYIKKTKERGEVFSTKNTVNAVEEMFVSL